MSQRAGQTTGQDIEIRVLSSIADLPAAQWDACANPGVSAFNPFISHDFLWALEASGSATAKTGWTPQHLVCADADGHVAGVTPCYLKSHSRG